MGDDNLIGEDLDSALRTLQNLTAQVAICTWLSCLLSISVESSNAELAATVSNILLVCMVSFAQPDQWPAVHEVEPQIGQVTQKPEVVDDFIRNFLVKMGLSKTLEMFETEW